MPSYRRADRVANEIKCAIAEVVNTELDDPRLAGMSITRVELSDDLRHAKVFFSMMAGREAESSAMKGIEHASGRFKRGIGRLKLRFIPDLVFIYDVGLEHSQRISDLLDRITHERKPEED